MRSRILFTIFPKKYWAIIGTGIITFFVSTQTRSLGVFLINLGILYFFVKIAIVIHEVGHLLAAKCAGGVPKRIILGRGHRIYQTRILRVTLEINAVFGIGFAMASFDSGAFIKVRYALYVLGGVMLNGLVVVALFLSFGFDYFDEQGHLTINIPASIILANFAMMGNLIPFQVNRYDVSLPTDGLILLRLPFTRKNEIMERLDVHLIHEGTEYFEQKQYDKALHVFRKYLIQYPDKKIIMSYVAAILLKTGDYSGALEKCRELIDQKSDKSVARSLGSIYNLAAWICLAMDDIPEADRYSFLAMQLIPDMPAIQGTRGSVLIELGQIDQGIEFLSQSADLDVVTRESLAASIYLMLAYHKRGDVRSRDRYVEFLSLNQSMLDSDERIVFERSLRKIA